MGRRYVAPPFTACPEWSERGGAGIDFPNRPFLKMWVTLSQLGEGTDYRRQTTFLLPVPPHYGEVRRCPEFAEGRGKNGLIESYTCQPVFS